MVLFYQKDDIELGKRAGILTKFGANGASYKNGALKWASNSGLYRLYEEKNPLLEELTQELIKYAHNLVDEERKDKLDGVESID